MRDLRLAVRALRATPVVSFVAVLSLALGIGANTAIFSIVDSLLLRTLPVADPARLVMVGDQLETDIAGARAAGIDAALLAGVSRHDPRTALAPTYVLATIEP